MSKSRLKGIFDYPKTPGLFFDPEKKVEDRSRTQQHFAKEADINTIMKRYSKTGYLVDPTIARTRIPYFGDVSFNFDFHALQIKLIEINDRFGLMPAEIREKFENSPEKCLNWLADPANAKEAGELGLLPKIEEPQAPEPPKMAILAPASQTTNAAPTTNNLSTNPAANPEVK